MNFIIDLALDIYFEYHCSADEALHYANTLFDELLSEPYIQYLQLRCMI